MICLVVPRSLARSFAPRFTFEIEQAQPCPKTQRIMTARRTRSLLPSMSSRLTTTLMESRTLRLREYTFRNLEFSIRCFKHPSIIIINLRLILSIFKLWEAVLYIDRFGVEVRGIERVKPEDRSALSAWDVWDSATMYL